MSEIEEKQQKHKLIKCELMYTNLIKATTLPMAKTKYPAAYELHL